MSLVRNNSEKQTSFDNVLDHLLGGQHWLYTKEQAIAMIRSGAMDSYLKTDPVLSKACSNQKCADRLIREMVARGANVNFQDSNGFTALHSAAFFRNPKAVDTLLELGANPLLQKKNGWYPLNAAVWQSMGDKPKGTEEIQDEITRVKSIVTVLITEGGNDPYFVYSSDKFQDKYAISDCNNSEVRKAMKQANAKRLKTLNDPKNPMTIMCNKHNEEFEKNRKNVLIEQLKQRIDLITADKTLKNNATIFDPAVPLVKQIKLVQTDSDTTDPIPFFSNISYSGGMASFEPIKIADYYFSLVCNMNYGFDLHCNSTNRYFFTLCDLETGNVVLKKVRDNDIDWTLQCLHELLLNKKEDRSVVSHSIFNRAISKEENVAQNDNINVLVKKNDIS